MAHLNKKGVDQGNMKPSVEGYQKPRESYSQSGFDNVNGYIARKDKQENKEAGKLRNQAYKGRYS
jgi:hypothetical protein